MAIKIKVTPVYLKYKNDINDYKIYSAAVNNEDMNKVQSEFGIITIVGCMPALIMNKEYAALVEEKQHPRYGINYEVSSVFIEGISSVDEEQSFLQCIVTERQFENIIAVYPSPISAIKNNQFDYKMVRGFSERSWKALLEKVEENECYTKAIVELSKYGLSFELIKKCVEKYNGSENAINIIRENPYRLYTDINGVGWKKADDVALALGIDLHAICRIEAAIFYCIDDTNDGSTWFTVNDIKTKAEEILGFDFESVEQFVSIVKGNDKLFTDGEICAIEANRKCEETIANELSRLITSPSWEIVDSKTLNQIVARNEEKLSLHYTDAQKSLFELFNRNNVVIMTGYAGTGKSQSLCGLLDILDYSNITYRLCSPTGKAAQQIERYTKRPATTIHRLLGFTQDANEYEYGSYNQIFTEVLVIDEFSMADIHLFRAVLNSVSSRTKLLLVGDPKQLSAVGMGNCLKDMIESGKISMVQLTEVFRQALDNGSLKLATAIRQGEIIFDKNVDVNTFGVNGDCIIWRSDKNEAVQRVVSLYKKLLGSYSIEDISVITPVRRNGCTSVNYLNELLQQVCNPPSTDKSEIETQRCKYRIGDKVIHVKNNYNAIWLDKNYNATIGNGVFNGNMGVIVKVNPDDNEIFVQFDGYIIQYTKDMLSELELAYAITTHKMQGSSAKVVIYIINSNSYMLNNRNNIYTALTRTTDKSFVLAEYGSLISGIYKEESNNRNTFLKKYLQSKTY